MDSLFNLELECSSEESLSSLSDKHNIMTVETIFNDDFTDPAQPNENAETKLVKEDYYIDKSVANYSVTEFIDNFRVSRRVARQVSDKFAQSGMFNWQSGANGKLSADDQTLIFLWYCGHQPATFRCIADRFKVSISTCRRILERLIHFVSSLSANVIKWPGHSAKLLTEAAFADTLFPGVIGIIDGTHIRIDKPEVDPDSYLNNKDYYSIQTQLVCDHNLKIISFFSGFPGAEYDSRIFRVSPLSDTLEEKCGGFMILGDSQYPCRSKLITPYKLNGTLTESQKRFNAKLASSREVSTQCILKLKNKFPVLYHVKLRSIHDLVHLIRACCVLHNMSLDDEFPVVSSSHSDGCGLDVNDDESDNEEPDSADANVLRDKICRTLSLI